jgi:hypothetical protein
MNHFIRKIGLNIPLDGLQKIVSIEIPRSLLPQDLFYYKTSAGFTIGLKG